MKFNLRKIYIITILVICIIAINLAVFFQITEKSDDTNYEQEISIDSAMLVESFNEIFDNTLNYQNNTVNIAKKDGMQEIIYNSYSNQEESEKFKFNVNIPYLNINSTIAEKINEEINSLFYNKATDVLAKAELYTVYNVRYKAYINDNILSLIINATLKEGDNPQRDIIKTYNYNLSSNSELSINEVLSYRNLSNEYVQQRIYETIKVASENANTYNELGYSKYLRNVNDSMYRIENTKVFFIGENKAIYILYPYGNSNYTSEIDLLVI